MHAKNQTKRIAKTTKKLCSVIQCTFTRLMSKRLATTHIPNPNPRHAEAEQHALQLICITAAKTGKYMSGSQSLIFYISSVELGALSQKKNLIKNNSNLRHLWSQSETRPGLFSNLDAF